MAQALMSLGDFRFSVDSAVYGDLSRESSYRWAEQERVGNGSALQYVGPGGESVKMSGVIFPHYKGGLGQLGIMRSSAAEGQPLRLITGRGDVLGLFVIESISENQTVFNRDGTPRKITFSLGLKRYGTD
jgi:uncharacterized protein